MVKKKKIISKKKKDYSFYLGIGVVVVVGLIFLALFSIPKLITRNEAQIDEDYIKQATGGVSNPWWKEEYTDKAPEELSEDVQTRLRVLTLNIEGMVCTGCAKAIKDSLEAEEGVITVKISFQDSTGTLVYDSGITNPENIVNSDIFEGFYGGKIKNDDDWS